MLMRQPPPFRQSPLSFRQPSPSFDQIPEPETDVIDTFLTQGIISTQDLMQWIDQEALCDFVSDRNLIEHCHNSVSEGGLGLIATCAESGVHSTNAKMLKEWMCSLNGSIN